jgi:hypothetical protein
MLDTLTTLRVQYPHRNHRSSRRHFRHGRRAAAVRAITAARLYTRGEIPCLRTAAEACGSNAPYVKAATVLIKSENTILLDRVLTGQVSLLTAAAQVRRVADLVDAYRCASENERVAFARTCNAGNILDVLIAAEAVS